MDQVDPLDFAIDLEDVRQRVEGLGYFLSVTDILEATEALNDDVGIAARPPAAFVAVSDERAQPNKTIGGHVQTVDVNLAILFVESALRADRQSRDQLESVRRAVIRQLIGWKPRNSQKPLEYVRYRVVSIGNGLAWGEVTFATRYILTTAANSVQPSRP